MQFDSSSSSDLGNPSDLFEPTGSAIVKNGVYKETINGLLTRSTNGTSPNGLRRLEPYFGHSRQEVVRLMMQAMNDLGYTWIAFIP
jgi:hypothetical protein